MERQSCFECQLLTFLSGLPQIVWHRSPALAAPPRGRAGPEIAGCSRSVLKHVVQMNGEATSLGTPASSKPGSGQCNDFLTFSGTKFGSDRKTEKFLSVFTGPGCRQVWSCVRKAVPALHADRHPPDPVATFELGILLPRGVSPVFLSSRGTGF